MVVRIAAASDPPDRAASAIESASAVSKVLDVVRKQNGSPAINSWSALSSTCRRRSKKPGERL